MPAVQLAWDYTQGSDPAVSFRIDRRLGTTGAWGVLDTIAPVSPGTATYTYEDATVQEGQTYNWRTVAVNGAGMSSAPSNVFALAVPGVLNVPTNLRGTLL